MFDRTYQPGGSFTPSGMADDECERVLWFRMGFGWVERRVEPAPVEVETGQESAA